MMLFSAAVETLVTQNFHLDKSSSQAEVQKIVQNSKIFTAEEKEKILAQTNAAARAKAILTTLAGKEPVNIESFMAQLKESSLGRQEGKRQPVMAKSRTASSPKQEDTLFKTVQSCLKETKQKVKHVKLQNQ